MTPEQFAYWLQGFAELNPNTPPNTTQWKQIQDHLNTVFKKETPLRVGPGIASPAYPNYPSPPTWPNPLTPYNPRPEFICSTTPAIVPSAPGAGVNWSSGAGDTWYGPTSYSSTDDVRIKSETNERFRL